jgi:OmpA-OmpF porin, OOP family
MRFIFAFVASALLASAPAFAADDSGFYVGAGVGDFGLEIDGQFMKYLAAELEYIDGGTAEDFGLEIDVSGFNLSAMGILPVGEKFNVFAKLGMIFWDADLGGAGRGSESGEDFSWGVGAGYDFTDQFGARVEYQGFEIEDADGDMISLGFSWMF